MFILISENHMFFFQEDVVAVVDVAVAVDAASAVAVVCKSDIDQRFFPLLQSRCTN